MKSVAQKLSLPKYTSWSIAAAVVIGFLLGAVFVAIVDLV